MNFFWLSVYVHCLQCLKVWTKLKEYEIILFSFNQIRYLIHNKFHSSGETPCSTQKERRNSRFIDAKVVLGSQQLLMKVIIHILSISQLFVKYSNPLRPCMRRSLSWGTWKVWKPPNLMSCCWPLVLTRRISPSKLILEFITEIYNLL